MSTCFRTRYAKNTSPTLTTIRFSHYCEKARWALDVLQYTTTNAASDKSSEKEQTNNYGYVEHPHAVITHMVSSLRHTSGLSTSTPVYITQEKRVIKDSSDTVQYVSNEL